MLDQKPRRFAAESARAHQHPGAFQLGAIQRELQIALRESRVRVGHFRRPGATVPHHDRAAAVFAFRNNSFETAIFDGVILHLHGQPLDGGIERGPFGHGPGEQDTIPFQAKIVMQLRSLMLLDDVGEWLA